MQRMKTNAASSLLENWLSKNMVYIYQHGGQHNEISLFPIFFIENKRYKHWKYQV